MRFHSTFCVKTAKIRHFIQCNVGLMCTVNKQKKGSPMFKTITHLNDNFTDLALPLIFLLLFSFLR